MKKAVSIILKGRNEGETVVKVMSIAGSDSFSGAGIQADLKTFRLFGVYGFTVITSVTSQNTRAVKDIFNIPPDIVASQIEAILEDSRVSGVKIGMIGDELSTDVIGEKIENHGLINIVLDPVIFSHSGTIFLQKKHLSKVKKELIPLSDIVTPNISEAEILTGRKISDLKGAKDAALAICEMGADSVLIKGGHANYGKIDLLLTGGDFHEFDNEDVATLPVHGTGCILSSAIVCGIASGENTFDSCRNAIDFVHDSIKNALKIGSDQRIAPI